MLVLIPLLPLLGFLLNASFGRRLGKSASGAIAVGAIALSFALSVGAVYRLVQLPPDARAIVQHVFTWITSGEFEAGFTLRLDPLSALMILVITGIGSLIHVYSTAYMHEERDAEYARYFSYLNLFAAFMLVLVLGANFVVMFVGWEGVGLCSYLLIGFWYQKKSASDAGNKAFIVNRIGDFGFLLGVFLVFVQFGTIDFQEVARAAASLSPETTFGAMSLITLLLFVGATGKSAQIPLFVWLPDAMEGPTPVSALIHAATMVTAGVYMIGRNAVLFSHAPETLAIVAIVGAATAFFAGTIGLVQNDIKRVLAYSTVSQLGYMFLAMGVGAFGAGVFHLYTHAFFKALLFLGSGAVIHALAGEQDLRRMGGLRRELPITYWTFLIGALAIAGVPLLSGFFSKDEILFRTYASGHTVLWVVGLLTSLLTAVYMFRLVFLAFHGERYVPAVGHRHAEDEAPVVPGDHGAPAAGMDRSGHPHGHGRPGERLHDAPAPMALALIALAAGSILAGYVGLPHALGGSAMLETFLEPSFTIAGAQDSGEPAAGEPGDSHAAESGQALELGLMGVSTAVALGGIAIAVFFFLRNRDLSGRVAERFSGLHTVLQNKYYVDEIYDATIVQPLHIVSEQGLWKGIDVRAIDGAVNGVAQAVGGLSERLRRLQTGSVRAYAASLFLGVVLILGYYVWR
ncbi:MAG: NADH-quinone oxidoreductase subunit L [Luteitalea sp.]|nr:NADH-quinone oxidoreductase subunit L [Luteitalea sp.]